MECYIIGFVIMFAYTMKEIHETNYYSSFKDYINFLFGLIIWPVILGFLLYDLHKTLNKIK